MASAAVPYDSISEIDPSNPNLSTDFDSLQFPPLDTDFLSNDLIMNEGLMPDLGFDDIFDFSFDDLSIPPGTEGFFVGDGSDFLSSTVPDAGDRSCSEIDGVLNSPSPDSGACDQEFSGGGAVSSQDSGSCRSVVDGFLNSSSPNSGVDSSSVSESFPNSCNVQPEVISVDAPNQKIKSEEEGNVLLPKRKKEKEDENLNPRCSKFRRSSSPSDNVNPTENDEDKKKSRLIRNRESAQLSRQRKKHYVEELEDKVRSMHSMIADLNSKVSYVMAENASLRQQLSGGVCPPPPVVYPPTMAPMPYPWIPCASYPVRPQGSQVALVPIPKLKPQAPKSTSTKAKKSESKKSEGKTKKVASVSFLGLLFFVLLFGGLVPFVNIRYGGMREMDSFNGHPRGRVVTVSGHVNASNQSVVGLCTGKSGFWEGGAKRVNCKRGWIEGDELDIKQNKQGSYPLPDSDGFVRLENTSDPLVASLYVPRNDKLVKIDGNLIIHSVLASEKAMASSRAASGVQNHKNSESSTNKAIETSLAIAGNFVPTLDKSGKNAVRHSHLYRSPTEGPRAITSGSRDTYKDNAQSTAADGSLQKWFREGLSGPILSSGMCTEVFQFDASPDSANPGAIVPATSTANVSAKHHPGSARSSKRMNRRILDPIPIPLSGTAFNGTDQDAGRASQNGTFDGNKSVSSMVVSVLVDPREADYSEVDGVISPKPLPRIFVVVLLDSVKYVTYSCVLPLKGSGPHLVTT